MLRLGFSREQAVPAGSSHQKVSSTAQEGLDFGIVLCYRRLFVRYISFFVPLTVRNILYIDISPEGGVGLKDVRKNNIFVIS